jgi:hypothetical protein
VTSRRKSSLRTTGLKDAIRVGDCGRRVSPREGTRLPVATIIENLEDLGIDEVIEQFDVSREQIAAVLDFIAESLRAEPTPTGARPL